MTHLLDQPTNGRIHHLEPLHMHAEFTTRLLQPHERSATQMQHTVVVDRLTPVIFVCAVVVSGAMWFGLWKLGQFLFNAISHVMAGI